MTKVRNQVTMKAMEIAASLWIIPATFRELCERDFLNNIEEYGVWTYICICKRRGWVYEKGDKFYTYKSAIPILNKEGFELNE